MGQLHIRLAGETGSEGRWRRHALREIAGYQIRRNGAGVFHTLALPCRTSWYRVIALA